MKKLIILSVIIFNLYASTKKIEINKSILSGTEYYLPKFLRFNPKSFIDTQISYNTLNKKFDYYLHIRIKLPALKINLNKTKKTTDKKTKTSYKKENNFFIKIRPYIRIKSKKIKFFIGNFLYYKNTKYKIQESYYFYPFNKYYWENSIDYSYFFKQFTFNTNFSTNKAVFPQNNYSFSVNKTFLYNKHLYLLSYGINGVSNKKPIIYSHQISIEYRQILFNKKRLFLTFKPYILYSKKYNFKTKFAVFTSINYKF